MVGLAVVSATQPRALGVQTGDPASGQILEGTVLEETDSVVEQVPGRLVVGFEEDASSATVSAVIEEADGTVTRSLPAIDASVIEVEKGEREEAVASLEAAPAVEYVEPEIFLEAAAVLPNDALWSHQWGPRRVRGPAAWEATRGSGKVVVAVVDTGVDAAHPDLDGALVPGVDIVNRDSNPHDDNGHGTAAAGVIAARTNNVRGQAGVCWRCTIMPVKVLAADGRGTTTAIASGILWAVAHGADVINLSLGGTGTTQALSDAVVHAASEGVVIVAAAGNNGNRTAFYPTAYPEVISVAGTTPSDRRYDWSNYGSWVQVAAPGCNVAPDAGGGYVNFCGTSSAAPVVSGIAALAYSLRPALSKSSFERALRAAAASVGTMVRYGRVNAVATLERLGLTRPRNVTRPSIRGRKRVASVLEARKGTWAGKPTRFSYRWLRCNTAGRACTTIRDARGPKYRLRAADLRSRIRVRVRAKNAHGGTTATSTPTRTIMRAATTRTRAATTAATAAKSAPPPTTEASQPPTAATTPTAAPPGGGDSSPSPSPTPSPPPEILAPDVDTIIEQIGQIAETASEAIPGAP
ncbi:MAG: S8 family peptidase [Gaiellaceae bacterium]